MGIIVLAQDEKSALCYLKVSITALNLAPSNVSLSQVNIKHLLFEVLLSIQLL